MSIELSSQGPEWLNSLLQSPEGERLEKTTSLTNFDKYGEAICAFANDLARSGQPGYLLIGVKDNGQVAGCKITDEFITALGGLRADGNIIPLPQLSIEKFSLPDGDVVAIKVLPNSLPPVRFKGRAWVRIGARKGLATREEEDRLAENRISAARTFDALPCREATLEDIDTTTFSTFYLPQAVAKEIVTANGRPIAVKLSALRFFDLKAKSPSFAAVLLFAKRPAHFLPGAFLQYLEIDGTSLGGQIVNEFRIESGLYWLPEKLDLLVQTLMGQRPQRVSNVSEANVFAYPAVALREFILNAIIHRSYEATSPTRITRFSDRIEIQSPGGLYGESRAENFPWQTSYRNPIIAEAFRVLGVVNRFGRGIVRAQEALRDNGNDEADFVLDEGFVRVVMKEVGGLYP